MKIASLVIVSLYLLCGVSCQRHLAEPFQNKENLETVRNWLQKSGTTYASESIGVTVPGKGFLKAHLLWDSAKQYTWNGRNYIDIPYRFANHSFYTTAAVDVATAGFSMVLRRKNRTEFEGAIRTTMYGVEVENLYTGEKEKTITQTYQLLNGQRANAWKLSGNATFEVARPVNFTQSQIRMLRAAAAERAKKSSTEPRAAISVCYPYTEVNYQKVACPPGEGSSGTGTSGFENDGSYMDPVSVTGYYSCYAWVANTYEKCDVIQIEDYPPKGGSKPPGDDETIKQELDPDCATAKKQAANVNEEKAATDSIFNKAKLKIDSLNNGKIEYGFAVMGELFYNPHEIGQVDRINYYLGSVAPGTEKKVTIPYNHSVRHKPVFTVHTHPPGGYAAPSANDVFSVVELAINDEANKVYQGSIILAADGSQYALTVYDKAKAASLLAKKDIYLDMATAGWKKNDTKAYKIYLASEYFFSSDGSTENSVFEQMLSVMLDELDCGVALHKADAAGNFKPLMRNKKIKTKRNGKQKTTGYGDGCAG